MSAARVLLLESEIAQVVRWLDDWEMCPECGSPGGIAGDAKAEEIAEGCCTESRSLRRRLVSILRGAGDLPAPAPMDAAETPEQRKARGDAIQAFNEEQEANLYACITPSCTGGTRNAGDYCPDCHGGAK